MCSPFWFVDDADVLDVVQCIGVMANYALQDCFRRWRCMVRSRACGAALHTAVVRIMRDLYMHQVFSRWRSRARIVAFGVRVARARCDGVRSMVGSASLRACVAAAVTA